jgi:SNF2 family DNA or RNA helicase
LIGEARALQDRASDGLRVSVYQAGLWEELLELGVVEAQSARWTGAVKGLLELRDVAPPPVPAGFEAELRPYQLDGFQWLAFLWRTW